MVKNTSLYSDSDLREKKEEIMKVDREIQRFANRFGEYDKNGTSRAPPSATVHSAAPHGGTI